jgi:hypothetical protein
MTCDEVVELVEPSPHEGNVFLAPGICSAVVVAREQPPHGNAGQPADGRGELVDVRPGHFAEETDHQDPNRTATSRKAMYRRVVSIMC